MQKNTKYTKYNMMAMELQKWRWESPPLPSSHEMALLPKSSSGSSELCQLGT